MTVLLDFHTHSTASDGALTPTGLIEVAAKRGVKYLALTDHNNVSGIEEASAAAKKLHIIFINGIELSCESNTHIIGLFLKRFDEIKKKSKLRGEYMKLSLESRGFCPDKYENLIQARDACIKDLVDTGRASGKTDAIEHFLQPPFGYGEAIDLIHNCGGMAILAHPNRINGVDKNDLPQFIEKLMHYGIDGLEVYQSMQSDEWTDYVQELAVKNNLLISGGSDYHDPTRTTREIGYYGNIENRKMIPQEVIENLWKNKDKYK